MISIITVQTNKFREEISFYETYAGMNIVRDLREHGKDIVFLAQGENETNLEVIHNPKGETVGNENISIGFHVENVEAMREQLSADGFEVSPFITPLPGVKFFFAKDPAGLNVQFM